MFGQNNSFASGQKVRVWREQLLASAMYLLIFCMYFCITYTFLRNENT